MGILKAIFASAVLVSASPAQADSVDPRRSFISEASLRYAVPEDWIISVMRAESGGKTILNGRPITSPAGAMGLMQIMPGTWKLLRESLALGANPHDPRDNIMAGTAYLRMMYDQFGYPGLFGAYNAGPRRYAAHLRGKSRLPAETIAYMASVAAVRSQPELTVSVVQPRAVHSLFYPVQSHQETTLAAKPKLTSSGLFITLNTVSGAER
jgi:soluble lytic murein transglycosylase-like protein